MSRMSGEPLCVICRERPAVPALRPFCSERCKMVDLGRWLTGTYRVPGASAEPESTDPDAAEPEESHGRHADDH
jgi:uncharacterized protein